MPTGRTMTSEEASLRVELSELTGAEGQDLDDLVTTAVKAPALLGTLLVQYKGQSWTDPTTAPGQRAIEILAALGGIASALGNVFGAVSGAKAI